MKKTNKMKEDQHSVLYEEIVQSAKDYDKKNRFLDSHISHDLKYFTASAGAEAMAVNLMRLRKVLAIDSHADSVKAENQRKNKRLMKRKQSMRQARSI